MGSKCYLCIRYNMLPMCPVWTFVKLALFSRHRTKLFCATSRGNFISSTFSPGSAVWGSLSARCRAVGHAARPPTLAAGGFAVLAHTPAHWWAGSGLALLQRNGVFFISSPPFARPVGPNRPYPAAPVRLRRPYNAENYFPRALQRVDHLLVTDSARARQRLAASRARSRACP